MNQLPRYEEAVRLEKSRRVVASLAGKGGTASFSDLEAASGVEGSVLVHHLNRLQRLNVIQKEGRGTYRLLYKTPLCFLYPSKPRVQVAYLGLLGKREDDSAEPEPKVALELLEKEAIRPHMIYVATSPEAMNEWRHLKLPYQWILCYEDEIINIDATKNRVTPQLEALMKEYITIIDCTSATKPATIAYYELAEAYLAPLIYIHEETRRLRWLISRKSIGQRLGIAL